MSTSHGYSHTCAEVRTAAEAVLTHDSTQRTHSYAAPDGFTVTDNHEQRSCYACEQSTSAYTSAAAVRASTYLFNSAAEGLLKDVKNR